MTEQIVFCEPHCVGFEHARFNAALLCTALVAYPNAEVLFLGEHEHITWLRDSLGSIPLANPRRIEWREMTVPRGKSPHWWHNIRKVMCYWIPLNASRRGKSRCVILSSVATKGLFVLKVLMFLRRTNVPVVAIFHNILPTIRQPGVTGRQLSPLRLILSLPHPAPLRYVALGHPVYQNLIRFQPALQDHFRILEMPRFPAERLQDTDKPQLHGAIRFGFFGVTSDKGFDTYFRLISEVQDRSRNAECVVVGYLNHSPNDYKMYARRIPDLTSAPISSEEYDKRARSVTYAVLTARPEDYQLRGSGSFVDAISHGKPGIYLKNDFVEYYFKLMGDIGYLCDTVQEMRDLMLSIVMSFPLDRYNEQCRNVERGRTMFEPGSVAVQLKAIINDINAGG